MICAIYGRKSQDQPDVADEAKVSHARLRIRALMPSGRVGRSRSASSMQTMGAAAASSSVGPASSA